MNAKTIAARRTQSYKESNLLERKTLSLDEIGRRIQLETLEELNLIPVRDVDGSSYDSFQKLSTEEIQ
jgi:hypothetical protein